MRARPSKYVDLSRAAVLLGISEEELGRISDDNGIGHHEKSDVAEQTFFTYEELRQICLLSVHAVH